MKGLELVSVVLGVIVMLSGVLECTRQILTVDTAASTRRQLAVYGLAVAPWVLAGGLLVWAGSAAVVR